MNVATPLTQIAVDLIRKEFPLRIRLLGIRMTNLKDLAAPKKGIMEVRRGLPLTAVSSICAGTDRNPGDHRPRPESAA